MRAEVPGFKAEEIKVSVESDRLIISGESESTTEEKTEQTVYNERRSRQFCRAIALPADVDPRTATATLKDGVLELALNKNGHETSVNVEVKTA